MSVRNVDWDQLRAQKEHLLHLLDGAEPDKDFIQGIINFIDSVQDEAAEREGEDAIYGYVGGFSPEDIFSHIENEEEVDLTDTQKRSLIAHMQKCFDASVGLCWDTIITHYVCWKNKQDDGA